MSLLNVIRCDLPQNDYLVWKWQPEKGALSRQNQIRYGSSLRVRAGEIAVFFYTPGSGAPSMDYIEGPADTILQTKNLPIISSVIGLAYGGDSPFPAEVYFINKGKATQLDWGVGWFDAFDPRFQDIPVPVSAAGRITFEIGDIKKFVEIQAPLVNFDSNNLRDQVIPQIRMAVKSSMVNLASAKGIPLIQIGGRLEDLSVLLQPTIAKVLEGFGMALRNFVFEGIEVNKESDGYNDLMRITREQVVKNLETQGEMGRKNMVDSQAINATHTEESQRIQREQLAKAQSLATESNFLQVHQINLSADVAKTAAQSLGNIGSGGGGGGDGGLGGIGAAALTLGMALPIGQAFGQQIIGNMQKTANPVAGPPCTQCNNTILIGAKFCPSCGTPTASSCAKCNTPLLPGAKFCTACGTPAGVTGSASKCSKCNTPIQPGAKFCLSCGAPAT